MSASGDVSEQCGFAVQHWLDDATRLPTVWATNGPRERSDMTWGDSQVGRPQIKTTLALLREGETEFQELTAMSDDAELVEKIAKLCQDRLRSIVFERVIAARYQP